ncbi:hypothetical protein AS156_23390 [Bradyrhizobium macuxiense]|uniref:Uncharacterized protein n=1 Tax=Bradyrhizobium macuxiense TaxID=1755647 RepID=A0A109JBA8_9BRAD|nr:hypothetical protein [Bradyrhizobium macuxiense]KWV45706.1 hypothetical protein AS156_23390 [Bradyrhizobium macuxiense]
MDFTKAAIESLQPAHWLIAVGVLLVIVGLVGILIGRGQSTKDHDDPSRALNRDPRARMPPLPDLLDSRPRNDRRPKPD